MKHLLTTLLIAAAVASPVFAAEDHTPKHGGVVVETKAGHEQNIVVLSLIGPTGPDPALCPTLDKCNGGVMGAEVATRIDEFTGMFTNGFIGRVCEPSYASFFQEAVAVIKSACDDFVPIL